MASKAFSGQSPKKPHLIHAGKGGVPGEVWDTRKDVDAAFRGGRPDVPLVRACGLSPGQRDSGRPQCAQLERVAASQLTHRRGGSPGPRKERKHWRLQSVSHLKLVPPDPTSQPGPSFLCEKVERQHVVELKPAGLRRVQ